MKALLQRVAAGSVTIEGQVRSIGRGLVVLLGIAPADTDRDAQWLIDKILSLRLFPAEGGKSGFDLSVRDVGGGVLLVSQFTLYADVRKGRRPDFTRAAPADRARAVYEDFVRRMREALPGLVTGEFGASMRVEIHNDGPVTLLIDSAEVPQE